MPDNGSRRIPAATSMKATSLPAPVPRGSRPPSDTLVDIHVYLVPKEKWVEKRKLAKNQVVDFSISSGFVRVIPTITLAELRREIHRQIGYDVIPRQYVFLRSVGRNFTQVKIRQEGELKVKNFMPPYAAEPEIYLKEGKYIGKSQQLQGDGIDQHEAINDSLDQKMDEKRGTIDGKGAFALPPPTLPKPSRSGSRKAGTTTRRRGMSRDRRPYPPSIFTEENPMIEATKEEPTDASTTKEQAETEATKGANVPNGDANAEAEKTASQIEDISEKRLGKDGTATIRSSQRGLTGEDGDLVNRSDGIGISDEAAQTTRNDVVIERARVRLLDEDGQQADHLTDNVVRILDVGEGDNNNHADVVHRTVLSLETSTEETQDAKNRVSDAETQETAQNSTTAQEDGEAVGEKDRDADDKAQKADEVNNAKLDVIEENSQENRADESQHRDSETDDKPDSGGAKSDSNGDQMEETDGKLNIAVEVVELENATTQTNGDSPSSNGNTEQNNSISQVESKEGVNTKTAAANKAEEAENSDPNMSPSKKKGGGSKIPLSVNSTTSRPTPRSTAGAYYLSGKKTALEDEESHDVSRTARTSGYASGGRPGSPSSLYGDVAEDYDAADEAENLLFLLYSGNLTPGEAESTKEKLRFHLEQLRSERRMYEGKREELIRRARALQSKSNQNKDVARETWRRRYLEAKRITPRLEDECAKMRLQLDQLHRELLARLQAGISALGRMEQPSNKLSYKIMIARLLEEIEDLRSRVDSTRIRLATEIRLRSQAEKDVRTLREELMKKKIQVTLTRNQQQSAFGPAIRSSFYVNPV